MRRMDAYGYGRVGLKIRVARERSDVPELNRLWAVPRAFGQTVVLLRTS